MKASQTQDFMEKARKEFRDATLRAAEACKSAHAAGELNRQAKLKFKQAKKWARHTKDLARKAEAKATEAQQALEKSAKRLKKAEKKSLKEAKRTRAKSRTAGPTPIAKASIKRKPAKINRLRTPRDITLPMTSAPITHERISDILDLPIGNPETPPIPPQPVN